MSDLGIHGLHGLIGGGGGLPEELDVGTIVITGNGSGGFSLNDRDTGLEWVETSSLYDSATDTDAVDIDGERYLYLSIDEPVIIQTEALRDPFRYVYDTNFDYTWAYSMNDHPSDVRGFPNGGVIVADVNNDAVRLSVDGDTLWTVNNPDNNLYDACVDWDNNAYLLFERNDGTADLKKVDSDGNTLWDASNIGNYGRQRAGWQQGSGIAVHPKGSLYWIDEDEDLVEVDISDGSVISRSAVVRENRFAISEDYIYIIFFGEVRRYELDDVSAGSKTIEPASSFDEFVDVWGVAVDPEGFVFVIDDDNDDNLSLACFEYDADNDEYIDIWGVDYTRNGQDLYDVACSAGRIGQMQGRGYGMATGVISLEDYGLTNKVW